jgi:MraZ protein
MAEANQLLGEYSCKLDPKCRIKVPAGLKRQFQPAGNDRFVINRGFEKCLVLYPYNEWQEISTEINKLNTFVKKNRDFARYFFRGATELKVDGTDRLLLPKHLLEYAEIENEAVLFAHGEKIEIWNKQRYSEFLEMESDDFADLAEEVMGGINTEED